jgi:hypothetical protein
MVERLYPGVYVIEIPCHVKPIEGVSTSTAGTNPLRAAAREARLPREPAPAWTQHNDSDPGITLVQLFAWLSESSLFRAQPIAVDRVMHASTGWGVAHGLAVESHDPSAGGGSLNVSPGLALAPAGRPIEPESVAVAHHVNKP